MGLVYRHPSQTFQLGVGQYGILGTQQDIFQHRGVGKQDIGRILSYLVSGIEQVLEAIVLCLLVPSAYLHDALSRMLGIDRMVVRSGFLFGQVTVEHGVGQVCSLQKFFQPLLLVLH